MMSRQPELSSDDLDVAEVARRKIGVFGSQARPIMLARAENYRRHGRLKSARFWQAVADTVEVIWNSTPKE